MKLRLGVIGVGGAWETRYLPALRTLSDRFEVVAVCDPVFHRAERAATQLQANACNGFRALVQRADVDAVLLLSADWFGPLPIHAACDASKAIYCAAAVDLPDEEAFALRQHVADAGVAFMAEFPCRLSPATLRLKELIATRLGPPQLVFCNRRRIASCAAQNGQLGCQRDLAELIDWCRYVVDQEPVSLLATSHRPHAEAPPHYFSMSLDFESSNADGDGPKAMITCGDYLSEHLGESLAYRRPADMKIVCERGRGLHRSAEHPRMVRPGGPAPRTTRKRASRGRNAPVALPAGRREPGAEVFQPRRRLHRRTPRQPRPRELPRRPTAGLPLGKRQRSRRW